MSEYLQPVWFFLDMFLDVKKIRVWQTKNPARGFLCGRNRARTYDLCYVKAVL